MDQNVNELIDKLKQAQNVLVTVSKDPSVDQLASAIGLTIALNNLEKHATAVFSGETPSTLEFLKPEETLEKDTNSLRDFIIALDKSKADKLRYKVENDVVRIFITPYKTSITDQDLDFSKGDFNVDVVVALGVQAQQDLDDAIQAHGRILHDATVASIMIDGQSELGTINTTGTGNSSLSEYVVQLIDAIDKKAIDSQAATALLTGIVAVTERFSNDRTSPQTMTISAELMAAGANQQLIANELSAAEAEDNNQPIEEGQSDADGSTSNDDVGTLEISHRRISEDETKMPVDDEEDAVAEPDEAEDTDHQIEVDKDGNLMASEKPEDGQLPEVSAAESAQPAQNIRGRVIEPPARGGTLTANVKQEPLDPATEELIEPIQQPTELMSHNALPTPVSTDPAGVSPESVATSADSLVPPAPDIQPVILEPTVPLPAAPQPPLPKGPIDLTNQPPLLTLPPEDTVADAPNLPTLAELEQTVGSSHAAPVVSEVTAPSEPEISAEASVEEARKAVEEALQRTNPDTPPEPIIALNAQPLGDELHPSQQQSTDTDVSEPAMVNHQAFVPAPGFEEPVIGQRVPSPSAFPGIVPNQPTVEANPAPPVPPPMIPPLPQ